MVDKQMTIKNFIIRILLFAIPFLFFIFLLAYIDPYNIIRKEQNIELLKLKQQIAYKINYPLYGLQKFENNPTDIIILGDSRANSLSEEMFGDITGKKSTNLAYGGGSIQEMIDTFWTVSKINKLKEVYIGISFNLYNKYNNKNRVIEANNLRTSLLSYLLSRYCIKSSFLIMESIIQDKEISIEKPFMNKDQFWQYQLDAAGPLFFKHYKYPKHYFNGLQKIAEYCKNNKIKLTFFIPPSHMDLQLKIKEYKLEKEYQQFRDDLISLKFPVYDFNFINYRTKDKRYFSDPFHFNRPLREVIIGVITGDKNYLREHYKLFKSFNL